MKWTEKQKGELGLKPINLDSNHWLYERPDGLELLCYASGTSKFVGTIQINTIRAYVRRWEKARVSK